MEQNDRIADMIPEIEENSDYKEFRPRTDYQTYDEMMTHFRQSKQYIEEEGDILEKIQMTMAEIVFTSLGEQLEEMVKEDMEGRTKDEIFRQKIMPFWKESVENIQKNSEKV